MNGAHTIDTVHNTPDVNRQDPVTLRDYLDVIRRRKWIVAGALIAMLALAGATAFMPPAYRAAATLAVDKSAPVVLLDDARFNLFADQAAQVFSLATIAELSKTDDVRAQAAVRLAPLVGGEDRAKAIIKRSLVQQVRNTELIRISVDHADPRVAAAAANAVAESFVDANLSARRQRALDTKQFIADQMVQALQRLQTAEDAFAAFRKQYGNLSIPDDATRAAQRLADLNAQLIDGRLQLKQADGRINAAQALLDRQSRLAPTQWTASPLVASLQAQLASLEVELSGLRGQFTPAAPAVVAVQTKIAETKRRLQAELARPQPGQYGLDPVYQQIVQGIRQDEITRAALRARETALKAALADSALQTEGLPARETALARLTRELKEAEAAYLLLSQRFLEARIAEASIGSAIRIVEGARVPLTPVRPRPLLHALLGLALGLILGVVSAFVVEQLDDTVKSAEEVERVLGVPVLGSIPRAVLRGDRGARQAPAALPPPKLPEPVTGSDVPRIPARMSPGRPPVVEAFHILRTHILASSFGVAPRVLLITSALPGDGKSTVVVNLAIAMARANRQVCLVDADLRHPALQRFLPEAASKANLAEFLAGTGDPGDVIHATSEPNLRFVPSGTAGGDPAALLASPRLTRLIEQARNVSEVVLIDAPPVLPVTDAEIIGGCVDGVLVVVGIGKTSRRALVSCRRRLESVGLRVVGAILNLVPAGRDNFRAYYDGDYRRDPGSAFVLREWSRSTSARQ